MRQLRILAFAGLLFAVNAPHIPAGDPPVVDDRDQKDRKLKELIEESIGWYDVYPDADADKAMAPHSVLSWRNTVREQSAPAMMVVWTHRGRPEAMASIFPWSGFLCHEFLSMSRTKTLLARDREKETVVWSPQAVGLEFQDVPEAPRPAETPAARLRQMKAMAERYTAVMTGWKDDNSDRQELRFLPRALYRYDLKHAQEPAPNLQDGALFAYVMGTDPEVVLALEAVGEANEAVWQFAFARATSGGLEAKLGESVVWKAEKFPPSGMPTMPNITLRRPLAD